MKNGLTNGELHRLLAFLAKSPLDRLIPNVKISPFSRDSTVCTGDQLADCAYLVLKGKCEQRCGSPNGKSQVIRSFDRGETFGGVTDRQFSNLATSVVAVEDSVILGIRLDDLTRLASNVNGHAATFLPGETDRTHTTFFFNPPKGRLVTLIFLSGSMPVALLAGNIARRLHHETGESVILVRLVASSQRSSDPSEETDCDLNGAVALPNELRRDESGLHVLSVGISGEPPDPEAIGELFRKLRRRFRHALVAVVADQFPAPHLFECVVQSNEAWFFLRRDSGDVHRLDSLLHEIRPRLNNNTPVVLKTALCLSRNEAVDDFDARIESVCIPPSALIHNCPMQAGRCEPVLDGPSSETFHADVRRVARGIGGCLTGLALSSGGAKGFAHIGVIQVLEENGIEVDVVAGASMGAYVGAIWAFGYDGQQMEELARQMESKRAIWTLIDPVLLPWQGFLRGYAVKRRLKRTIGDARFVDLARPLRVVAADLETLDRVVFSSGDVATAVHASIAVPGICVPVQIGGEAYVDGGIVDPLPTDVLQEMGIRRIIAVNTIPTPDRIRNCLQAERERVRPNGRGFRKLVHQFLSPDRRMKRFANGHIIEILMHSTHGAQIRVAEAGSRRASIVLRPEICDDHWLDFRNPEKYIRAGREVASRHIEEIRALVQPKGIAHEFTSSPRPLAEVA